VVRDGEVYPLVIWLWDTKVQHQNGSEWAIFHKLNCRCG
jgi:hypothetical protein